METLHNRAGFGDHATVAETLCCSFTHWSFNNLPYYPILHFSLNLHVRNFVNNLISMTSGMGVFEWQIYVMLCEVILYGQSDLFLLEQLFSQRVIFLAAYWVFYATCTAVISTHTTVHATLHKYACNM